MKNLHLVAAALAVVAFGLVAARAQSTSFTFQGSLKTNGAAASGSHDFEFALYDAAANGAQLGATVTNGAFSVELDFGAQFPGAARYVEVRVRPSGGGAFTTLAPRSPVGSAPYSLKSVSADVAANATNAITATTANNALKALVCAQNKDAAVCKQ